MATKILLSNASATGADVTAEWGGTYVWSAAGTFGGATLTLQAMLPDGATRLDVATLGAPGAVEVDVGAGSLLRVAVTGGSPSALHSDLRKVL